MRMLRDVRESTKRWGGLTNKFKNMNRICLEEENESFNRSGKWKGNCPTSLILKDMIISDNLSSMAKTHK